MGNHYTNRLVTLLAVGVIAGAAAFGETTLQKVDASSLLSSTNIHPRLKEALKAPTSVPMRAASSTSDIIVNEDFSGFTYGSINDPDGQALVSQYDPNIGIMLPEDMTNTPGWYGTEVYSAGGVCLLDGGSAIDPAVIGTPLGDWSGDIVITCRVKAVTRQGSGASFSIVPVKGNYLNSEVATTDDDSQLGFYQHRFYEKDGWAEVTYSYRNTDTDPLSSIWFFVTGAVFLDDIKITAGNENWIAEPVVGAARDFTPDGFTIDWSPVRKAFSYRVMLYEMKDTGEGIDPINLDFDDTTTNEYVTISENMAVDPTGNNQGVDGSKALQLMGGEAYYMYFPTISVVTPVKLHDASFRVKPSEGVVPGENFMYVDVLKDPSDPVRGWVAAPKYVNDFGMLDFSEIPAEGIEMTFDGAEFEGLYYGIRVQIICSNETTALYLDNLKVNGMSATELVESVGPKSVPGYYYDTFDDDGSASYSYTFTDLDPDKYYYYAVRSHYQLLVSDSKIYEAFGVSSPEDLDVKDIVKEPVDYTATFVLPNKATGFEAETYGVTDVEQAGVFTVLDENFDAINAFTTNTDPTQPDMLGNFAPMMLDFEMTDEPGWIGHGNGICQGMVGVLGGMGFYMATPPMNLVNASTAYVTMKCKGTAGDNILIIVGNTAYGLPLDSTGEFNDRFELPLEGDLSHVQILLASMNGMAVMFDQIKIEQQATEGSKVLRLIDLGAGNLEGEYTPALREGYASYATRVYSTRVTAVSNPTDYLVVDIENGTAELMDLTKSLGSELNGIETIVSGNATGIETRYDLSGRMLSEPMKGINIVRRADGTVVKEIVR